MSRRYSPRGQSHGGSVNNSIIVEESEAPKNVKKQIKMNKPAKKPKVSIENVDGWSQSAKSKGGETDGQSQESLERTLT